MKPTQRRASLWHHYFCLVCLALAAVWPSSGTAEAGAWEALKEQEGFGVRVSAMVLDLNSGRAIQSLNAGNRLSPASVSKLVVSSAALATWSVDKVFETRLLASGEIRDGRLAGDLLITSDGDASFDHLDLWHLAGRLRAAGVRSIGGSVVALPAFGPLPCGDKDRCEATVESRNAYDAPMSALGVDLGTWCIEIQPGNVGTAAQIKSCAGTKLPIPVRGQITTGKQGSRSTFKVIRRTESGRDHLDVSGSVAADKLARVHRSMSDPALGTALLLRQMLQELGISVAGVARVQYTPGIAPGTVIARVSGLPLGEQIGRMIRYSNNYLADLLTLNVARARTRSAPRSLAEAGAVLTQHLTELTGTAANPPNLLSGSGLTPENRVSAQDIVSLLQLEYQKTETFPAFYGAMVVPRQAPSAFLRGGGEAWQDRVALKSGTLTEPDPVRCIAGYLRKKDGGWMAFAVLVNGSTSDRRHNNRNSMAAIKADIDQLLQKY